MSNVASADGLWSDGGCRGTGSRCAQSEAGRGQSRGRDCETWAWPRNRRNRRNRRGLRATVLQKADVIIVGGGIVGLGTALALVDRAAVSVIEAERELAEHQTG